MESTSDEKSRQRSLRRKAWLRPLVLHIKSGRIVEFGCGSGFVLEDLSREFPDSSIIGIDRNRERLSAVQEKGLPNVETMNADITTKLLPDNSADTVLYVGVLHEVFSASGRDKVRETLRLGHGTLKDGGVLVIQDFLKPAPQPVTLAFRNQRTREMFLRYVREFRLWTVEYEETEGGVRLDIVDAVEFLTKYRSPSEEDWSEEMAEAHHYFTLKDFEEVTSEAGFVIKESTKLLNPDEYFEEIREDVDFDFDESKRAWIQLVLKKDRMSIGGRPMDDFVIKKTRMKGLGLFTARDIKEGEHLFHVDLRGLERYTVEEIDALSKADPNIDGDHFNYVGWGKYVIEKTLPSYMNHSCEPNCVYKMRSIAVYDVYAARDILKGEELTHDYGATAIDQLLGYFYWEDECRCGSENCRRVIHGDFFKLPRDWQRRHYPNLPPYIKRKYREYFRELLFEEAAAEAFLALGHFFRR